MAETQLEQGFRIGAVADGPDKWLEVIPLTDVEPLTGGVGAAAAQTVPDALQGILFDDPTKTETPLSTFAILDAAACSILPEILETADIRHKCLFTGDALEDYKDAAPWLVELKPDHRLTRNLMSTSDAPGGLWEMELGIIVKTAMSFDALWAHCRKFTRLQDEEGKWLYYRYWSPPVSTRVMALGNRPELIQFVSPLFPPAEAGLEAGLEVLLLNSDMHALLRRLPGTTPPPARPVLTKAAQETIRQVRRVQQYEEIIDITIKHVKDQTGLSDGDVRASLRLKRDGLFRLGFWQRDHLAKLMVWEILLGPEFIDSYANGTIGTIISAAKAPYEAIMNIEFFLEAQEIRRVEAERGKQGELPE